MAFGQSTFSDISGAVSDIFQGQATAAGLRLKAEGDLAEAKNYDLASALADQNEKFTETSTSIKESQADRNLYMTIGGQKADVAAGGFAASGSSLDLLRSSASQGALNRAVLGEQGLITEAGYKEQADSYTNMSQAARQAAAEEQSMADKAESNSYITGAIKGVAAIATLFA